MGFGTVSRLFHWVTVLLVALMIPVGLVMTQDIPRSLQDPLFMLHKGLGPIVLVVVLARLGVAGLPPGAALAGGRAALAGEGGAAGPGRALFLPVASGG